MLFRTRLVSSLEKVLCRRELDADPVTHLTALRDETVAFQIAVQAENSVRLQCAWESPLQNGITVREVGLVPCCQPALPDDSFALVKEPGFYPDPLLALHNDSIRLTRRNWHSLWVSIRVPPETAPGSYFIRFRLSTPDEAGYEYAERELSLPVEVLDALLPQQQLRCTNWLYCDSLAAQHKIECWSEAFWEILATYFKNMAEHGTNMVLTPLWSLMLDAVKQDRPTVQLLVIHDDGAGHYRFDFSRLERWLELARKQGIDYFEMSHAYTQWGATGTPKVVIETAQGPETRFGWNVAADSPLYQDFLRQLMPQLLRFLRGKGLTGHCYFHVSDEPTPKDLDTYRRASAFFTPLAEDFPIIDALSAVAFYREKLVRLPVPSTETLETFMKEAIAERWCYYCSGTDCLPNRYIGLPSLRNRILGLLLYIYNLDGFLHWGYNGWYTRPILDFGLDPYRETEGGRFYSSGAGTLVYPGHNGPVDSLRHEVFREGLQDLRILRLVEAKIGRERTLELIQKGVPYPVTLRRYPRDNGWYLALRDRLCRALDGKMNGQ